MTKYIVIQDWMVNDLGLKNNDLLVYTHIYHITGGERKIDSKSLYQSIISILRVEYRTYRNTLSRLVKKGLIIETFEKDWGITYRINTDKL